VPIFVRRSDYRAFLQVIREGLEKHDVQLVAYCVMSNHWHMVLEPAGTEALVRFMQWVTATHAIRWRHHHKTIGQGAVYKGRYHSTALGGITDVVGTCRYVERNALTAGLVRRAEDWPWGSLSDRLRPSPAVPLRSARFLASQAWIDYVNAQISPADRRQIAWEEGLITVERPIINPISGTDEPEAVEKSSVPFDAPSPDTDADPPQHPGALAGGVEGGQQLVGDLRRADEHHADAHVERAQHLRVVNLARALKPREQRRHRPALPVE
jgi:REP element-mobilizing transposase RayT